MNRRRITFASLCSTLVVAFAGAAPAGAAAPDPVQGADGKQWRQLYETTGATWSQVAGICPQDGATPCSGSLAGWIWGTADQVVSLLAHYEPAIAAADPPSVSGDAYFWSAIGFLTDMRWTGYISLYEGYSEWTAGWTSSTDDAGRPMVGHVGYGWWPPGGAFSVSGVEDQADRSRGIWLWRPADDDLTPPRIASTVSGTSGNAGWFVSDVSVTWDVEDAESAISSQEGCDPATVDADTAGTTLACTATSAGGTSTASIVVMRDTTPPEVTCASPAPVFDIYEIGAWVPATVTDETSGPGAATVLGATSTNAAGTFLTAVTGADRAGNTTTAQCSYQVVVPTCNGLAPTRVGTAANDVISGTSGRDVIVGLGGADTITGLGGDDVICGGDGPDDIDGGAGNDWIDGGPGNDSLRGGNGTDTCLNGEARLSSCEL
jgi:hypothetical protein